MMYNKNQQLQKTGAAVEKNRVQLSALVTQIHIRKYGIGDSNAANRIAMAIENRDQVPPDMMEKIYLYTERKAGRRIGLQYGLVDQKELTQLVAMLISPVCMYLGVPFDQNYLIMSTGLAIHLQQNFPKITFEELEKLATNVFLIPLEVIPEAYQVFDMKAFSQIVHAYNRHVFGKIAGKADAFLKEHFPTKLDEEFEAKRKERERVDARYLRDSSTMEKYPADMWEQVKAVYHKWCKNKMEQGSYYLAVRTACGERGTIIAGFVHECLLSLSKAKKNESAQHAWQRALTESNRTDRGQYQRFLQTKGDTGELNSKDLAYMERLYKMHLMAFQFKDWHDKHYEEPPKVTIKNKNNEQ